MTKSLIEIETNLQELPVKYDEEGSTITVGDMHGNALKMIHFLCMAGVVELCVDDYNKLKTIYYSGDNETCMTSAELKDFEETLNAAKYDTSKLVRFIGDTLADRGRSDCLTLLLYKILNMKDVTIEVLLSNHDLDFIACIEAGKFPPAALHGVMDIGHKWSVVGVGKAIANKLITKENVDHIYEIAYAENLKLLSYDYSDDELIIYSHAPIHLGVIESLLKSFNIESELNSINDYIVAIKAINTRFSKRVKEKSVFKSIDNGEMRRAYTGDPSFEITDPVVMCAWNRYLHKQDLACNNKAFNVSFVHGHVSQVPSRHLFSDAQKEYAARYHNLDCELGKGSYNDTGVLRILYGVVAKSFELQASPSETEILDDQFTHDEKQANSSRPNEPVSSADNRCMMFSRQRPSDCDQGHVVSLVSIWRQNALTGFLKTEPERTVENKP